MTIRRRFQVSLNAGDAWRHVVTGDRLTAFTVRGGYLTAALGAELANFFAKPFDVRSDDVTVRTDRGRGMPAATTATVLAALPIVWH